MCSGQIYNSIFGGSGTLLLSLQWICAIASATAPTLIFVNTLSTFDAAELDCQNTYNGHLVSIHSSDKNIAVATACLDIGQFQSACLIGLNNPIPSKWTDGTIIDYSAWYGGEPDGGAFQPVVSIRQGGDWHTIGQVNLPYVCEMNDAPSLLPTNYPTYTPTHVPTQSPKMLNKIIATVRINNQSQEVIQSYSTTADLFEIYNKNKNDELTPINSMIHILIAIVFSGCIISVLILIITCYCYCFGIQKRMKTNKIKQIDANGNKNNKKMMEINVPKLSIEKVSDRAAKSPDSIKLVDHDSLKFVPEALIHLDNIQTINIHSNQKHKMNLNATDSDKMYDKMHDKNFNTTRMGHDSSNKNKNSDNIPKHNAIKMFTATPPSIQFNEQGDV